LSQSVQEAIAHRPVAQRLEGAGVDGVASTPEQLAAFLRAEAEKWGRVVRQAGIRVE
jgi:tripartite-type tricarboxylate transporter receptor subunit TctC